VFGATSHHATGKHNTAECRDNAASRQSANQIIRSDGNRTANWTMRAKPAPIQPAIALAGPTNARIVVVSADQVQRERAQTAQPAIRKPRIAVSGLSGRRAFEALFADATDPSKGSRQ
jgi:hypothetical protein